MGGAAARNHRISSQFRSRNARRVVVLASGSGSNLQAIIDACASGQIDGAVVHVVSDRHDAFALQRAHAAGIAATHLARRDGESRAAYDTRLADVVEAGQADIVVLAGWMRILTMSFLSRFPERVVNIHPALPGELPGTDAVARAYEQARRGERSSTGVMVHLVPDEGVDDGPVLGTITVPIDSDDTMETLTERVHAAEHRLLVHVLADMCQKETAS
jgi:phosphoribosylglycinamide formyltransferase 1